MLDPRSSVAVIIGSAKTSGLLALRLPMCGFEKVRRWKRNRARTLAHQLVAASDNLSREIAGTEGEAGVLSGDDAVRHLELGWESGRPKWPLAAICHA